jgi:hypothetical protein
MDKKMLKKETNNVILLDKICHNTLKDKLENILKELKLPYEILNYDEESNDEENNDETLCFKITLTTEDFANIKFIQELKEVTIFIYPMDELQAYLVSVINLYKGKYLSLLELVNEVNSKICLGRFIVQNTRVKYNSFNRINNIVQNITSDDILSELGYFFHSLEIFFKCIIERK